MSELLLHPEHFERVPVIGGAMREAAEKAASRLMINSVNAGFEEPSVSVVIRTRNDALTLPGLVDDIGQQFYEGDFQMIVVDAESSDGTQNIAKQLGATVRHVSKEEFHNGAIEKGFEAADNDIVFSLVGHTQLMSKLALRATTAWMTGENPAAAVYGLSVPAGNASLSERFGAAALGAHTLLETPAAPVKPGRNEMGALAADCSLISKQVYDGMHGINRLYQVGGADGELAARMLEAGVKIIRDPAVSVHHTHGLHAVQTLKQLMFWRGLGYPRQWGSHSGYDYCSDLKRHKR